jgi:hypothetical protein
LTEEERIDKTRTIRKRKKRKEKEIRKDDGFLPFVSSLGKLEVGSFLN